MNRLYIYTIQCSITAIFSAPPCLDMCPAPHSKANESGKLNMCSVHKELNYSTNKRHFTISTRYLHTFKGKKAHSLSLFERNFLSVVFFSFWIFLRSWKRVIIVFFESYFSIFSEMFPFSGFCTRCAMFAPFFSCCCFAAQVYRATRCCSLAFFVLISHNINRVIGCFNVLALQ